MRRMRMTRELRETLDKMRMCLLHKESIRLTPEELRLVIVYIMKLETAVVEGVDEINY
jgi:hypothetical protein